MFLDPEEIKSILYSPQSYNALFDYFSLQEKQRLVGVFDTALEEMPEPSSFGNDYEKWKNSAQPRLVKEFQSAKEYFGRQNFMAEFNLEPLLKNVFVNAANPASFQTLDLGEAIINRYFNLDQASLGELLDSTNFEAVKYKAYTFVDSVDYQGAIIFATNLDHKLFKAPVNSKQEKTILDIFNFWALRLKVFGFTRLKSAEKFRLIKERAGDIFEAGFDLENVVLKLLNSYESEKIRNDIAGDFKSALSESQSPFAASQSIERSGGFQPTIANWLKEYYSVMRTNMADQAGPGAFHIVKFMDSNKYGRMLNSGQKQVLQKLLEFYNLLLNPLSRLQPLDFDEDTPSYTNSQTFQLPGDLQPASTKQFPPVPVPTKAAPALKLPEAKIFPRQNFSEAALPAKNLQRQKSVPPIVNKPYPIIPSSQPQNRVNVQDILKSRYEQEGQGNPVLSMGGGNGKILNEKLQIPNRDKKIPNSPLNAGKTEFSVGREEKQTQEQIDKKLEDLEKRVK